MDSVANLIAEEISVNEIGQEQKAETARQVFCRTRAITRSEFYAAANAGLKPEAVLVLSSAKDYAGERHVEWEGTRYTVMRTYQPEGSDSLELVLQEEVDDYGG